MQYAPEYSIIISNRNSGSLTQMTVGDDTLIFAYDGTGKPMAVTWNGTTYLYLTNIQGDVIAILDADGNFVVSYDYDAWGRLFYMSVPRQAPSVR